MLKKKSAQAKKVILLFSNTKSTKKMLIKWTIGSKIQITQEKENGDQEKQNYEIMNLVHEEDEVGDEYEDVSVRDDLSDLDNDSDFSEEKESGSKPLRKQQTTRGNITPIPVRQQAETELNGMKDLMQIMCTEMFSQRPSNLLANDKNGSAEEWLLLNESRTPAQSDSWKLNYVSTVFDGKAAKWWSINHRTQTFVSWKKFHRTFLAEFERSIWKVNLQHDLTLKIENLK